MYYLLLLPKAFPLYVGRLTTNPLRLSLPSHSSSQFTNMFFLHSFPPSYCPSVWRGSCCSCLRIGLSFDRIPFSLAILLATCLCHLILLFVNLSSTVFIFNFSPICLLLIPLISIFPSIHFLLNLLPSTYFTLRRNFSFSEGVLH